MKRIGILGGMGPMATVDLYQKIILNSPFNKDQEHFETVIVSLPTIPNRSEYILESGKDPYYKMLEGIAMLEASNVDVIAIACNTAHHFVDRLSKKTLIPIINMIDIACSALAESAPVVVMSTIGTASTGLYKKAVANKKAIMAYEFNEVSQASVDAIIAQVKAGNMPQAEQQMNTLLHDVPALKTATVILACTELPLLSGVFAQQGIAVIDPTLEVAKYLVALAQT
jgi:aspartate racemase